MGRGRNRRRKDKRRAKNKELKDKKPKQHKQKYRSPKRKARKQMLNPEPIRLGITASFLADKGNKEFLALLHGWLKKGIISELVFIAYGKWNNRTQARFKSIVDNNNFSWAWNYLVFKMPSEFQKQYLLRCISCYGINHYVDSDSFRLATLVLSKHYDNISAFYWNNKENQIDNFSDWLKKHNRSYTLLNDMGEDADVIIGAKDNSLYIDYEIYGGA